MTNEAYMIPTSKKEVGLLGWDYIDVIIFSGDAFIDHPSFGTAVIARTLQSQGYRVAVVPQPNWRDDLRDFKKLGVPRLYFGVNSGAMDSMVNHYTANMRLRSDDAYTPEGKAGARPDYAVTVYTRILKSLYKDVPVVIGGIEASLRRFAHYDYWKNCLLPSILVDSGADFLTYGMGEKSTIELTRAIDNGEDTFSLPQVARYYKGFEANDPLFQGERYITLQSFEKALANKRTFVENFNIIEREANRLTPCVLVEPYKEGVLVVNPPYPPATEQEMDEMAELPYTKLPHPRYKNKRIPAYDMIKFSITSHRGCFGGCSFCTIAAHQGRFIQSRSVDSVVKEAKALTQLPDFKGVISDVGGPTANMYMMGGKNKDHCAVCKRKSCLFPARCPNLDYSHKSLLNLYNGVEKVKGIKNFYIGSGIRYDLFLDNKGFLDATSKDYFNRLVKYHVSGRLKVAPEHTQDNVLRYLGKPSFSLFRTLRKEFDLFNKRENKKYQLIPYFISSHPGCTLSDMAALSHEPSLQGVMTEQVQDFTPTPMTRSSAMFYSGLDTKNLKPIFVERKQVDKKKQKSFFFKKKAL